MELKQSTVRTWRNMYQTELKRENTSIELPENSKNSEAGLPVKKRGRPLLLGEELD